MSDPFDEFFGATAKEPTTIIDTAREEQEIIAVVEKSTLIDTNITEERIQHHNSTEYSPMNGTAGKLSTLSNTSKTSHSSLSRPPALIEEPRLVLGSIQDGRTSQCDQEHSHNQGHGHAHGGDHDHQGHGHSHGHGPACNHHHHAHSDDELITPTERDRLTVVPAASLTVTGQGGSYNSFTSATELASGGCGGGAPPGQPKKSTYVDPWVASPKTRKVMKARKALTIAIIFCACFMVIELVSGVIAHSIALVNDAVHMMTDVFNLGISLAAVILSTWAPTVRMSFGFGRAEVIGALASVFTTWMLVLWILVEAGERIVSIVQCARGVSADALCDSVDSKLMLIIGACGFFANIGCLFILMWGGHHGHSHGVLGSGNDHGCSGHGHSGDEEEVDDHGHSHDGHACSSADKDHGHSHDQHDTHDCGGGHDHGHNHDDHGHGHDDHGHSHDGHACSSADKDHGHSHDDHHGHSHDGGCVDHGPTDNSNHHGGNMNLRGAILHVIGDCLQSLGVVIAAGVIWAGNKYTYGEPSIARSYYNLADPFCSILFAVITTTTTFGLIKDVLVLLMEGCPKTLSDLAGDSLKAAVSHLEGVVEVRGFHVWMLGTERSMALIHIVLAKGATPSPLGLLPIAEVSKSSESELAERIHDQHSTITATIKRMAAKSKIDFCTVEITYE